MFNHCIFLLAVTNIHDCKFSSPPPPPILACENTFAIYCSFITTGNQANICEFHNSVVFIIINNINDYNMELGVSRGIVRAWCTDVFVSGKC